VALEEQALALLVVVALALLVRNFN